MASEYVDTADCAEPFDFTRLPKSVLVVLGYVGQRLETPHVWTDGEVRSVAAAGRVWAPIHTVPPSQLTEQIGLQAGNLMVAELAGRKYPKAGPVFLDVEHKSYVAHPAEAKAGVAAWKKTMHAAGYPVAYAYLPLDADTDWVAHWTDVKPASLPDNWIGHQWSGPIDGGRYDPSVFRRSVFSALLDPKGVPVATLDNDDKAWLVAQLNTVTANVYANTSSHFNDTNPKHSEPHANIHLDAKLDQVLTHLTTGSLPPVNVADLATAILGKLGPAVAAGVVTELSKRLQS